MGEASSADTSEDHSADEPGDQLPRDPEAVRQAAQLEGVERDLDTVDAALSALDSDDLERAEALAAELEESAGEDVL